MSNIVKAKIIEKIQGFYEAVDDNNNKFTVKLRGTLKKTNDKLNCVIGDIVQIDVEDNVIIGIEKRNNLLLRPLISNVDYVAFVCSIKDPDFDIINLYKNLLWVDRENINTILILNKIDLVDDKELEDILKLLSQKLKHIKVIAISIKKNIGIDKLKEYIENKNIVLSGVSGVGKSILVNKLLDIEELEVGEISKKTKKGKNTTINTRYLEKNKIKIYDTPGYSAVAIPDYTDKKEIMTWFPEFKNYLSLCKFRDCLHIKEPSCIIKFKVSEGEIDKDRYEFYKTLVENKGI
ncbi:ribosome small subunit-dependent GTPase A [Oceanivirga miroungae]|uniref:Small ribosomal subunit biogenesis GTPase RsgA n=1 Tax=Oceanivirga miroungae TaxID=1130046 RepID=A0A6I8ME50_9FUSO|nr:ribosome small subunit-dependent GTPase A [Oceanivirga miroungae]VWL85850.1 ribosome small subunit-dependent GTPase A [Oceanivirga miroungae]